MTEQAVHHPRAGFFQEAALVLGSAALLFGSATGCEPSERLEVEPYCDYQDEYDIDVPFAFEAVNTEATDFFCYADETADGYPANLPFPAKSRSGECPLPLVEAIEGGPFCPPEPTPGGDPLTHGGAMVIRYGKHDSWGGRYANWNWRGQGAVSTFVNRDDPDAGRYEGIALWAKAGPVSDRLIYILLDDENTNSAGEICIEPVTTIEGADADQQSQAVVAADPNVDTSTNAPQGSVPAENHCGNSFRQLLEVSDQWELHLLPFSDFYQEAQPNRSPQGLGSELHQLWFDLSRGNAMELWIDQIMLYRRWSESAAD